MGQERQTREELRAAAGDPDALAAVLDPLAADAAAGSAAALELVLWAVDELGLAQPPIRSLLVNRADIEDVSQDVLIAVAETIGRFRGGSRFRTWLNQVARFKAIAHLRRKRDEAHLDDAEPSDTVRISSVLAEKRTLHDVMEDLPSYYYEAVVLRDVHQLPYDEIGRKLEITPASVRSRVARGRALVAARLAER